MATLYKRGGSKVWYAVFQIGGQRFRRSTGTTNKRDAQAIMQRWIDAANLRRHGALDECSSLESLLQDYLNYLGNSSPKHLQTTESRLRAIIEPHGWTQPEQITQYGVETSVRNLVHHKTGEPLSLRTQSHYLACAKTFTAWLVTTRKALAVDPLTASKKPRFDSDRRLTRRFLTPAEWWYLSQTEHALLYETAIQTGLRSSELLAVRPAHLHSDHILLPGRFTKNGQDAQQWITSSLATRLAGRLPFSVPDYQRLAKLLRRDLRHALQLHLNDGPSPHRDSFLRPTDARGHTLDFHSLRHTCGAWLAMRGVQPKVIQSVMRHSSITLTLDTYGHLFPGAERDAIQHFAALMD